MTIAHHPREETLVALAAGSLAGGPRLVVATHLLGCPRCRDRVRAFEAVGGALLADVEPTNVADDMLARTFARIEALGASGASLAADLPPAPAHFPDAPETLRRCVIGPWRFIQPGLRISWVSMPDEPEASALLFKVGAGRQMPEHGHTGVEYTQVLKGAFSDLSGRYASGDCIEVDDDVEHQPVADSDGDCICLAAVDGRLKLHSLVGRIVQPFMGL